MRGGELLQFSWGAAPGYCLKTFGLFKPFSQLVKMALRNSLIRKILIFWGLPYTKTGDV
jgi:hypothetical protein